MFSKSSPVREIIKPSKKKKKLVIPLDIYKTLGMLHSILILKENPMITKILLNLVICSDYHLLDMKGFPSFYAWLRAPSTPPAPGHTRFLPPAWPYWVGG